MLLKIYLLSVLVVGHVVCGNHSNQTETETAPEVEPEVLPEQEPPQSVDVTESSPAGPVEPLDIHGLDNRQTVFHQKHQVPNGNIAGTYGYYDSLGRYHVLNYVQDQHGIRITNDYMPFESPPGSGAGHRDQRPHDLQEDHEGRPPAGQHEPLAESDGDNLLRDEHSVIRTTVVPPPGAFFNNFGFYPGNDVAGSQVVPYNVHRRNSTQHYNRPFPQALYQQRVPHRIPYPYENPLYPLLYTDPNKNNQGGNQDDDVNDTSGLDSSDGVSEVPSKPIRSRPVSHVPSPSARPQYDSGYANSLYGRPPYQQTNYYHHYSQPSRQQQYLVQPVHQYQGPVRPQAYYPQHHYQQQQYQSYYYQPVVAGYNRYEPYNYGYNHR